MILFIFMKYVHSPAKKEEYLHLAVNVHVFALGGKNLFKYLCADTH